MRQALAMAPSHGIGPVAQLQNRLEGIFSPILYAPKDTLTFIVKFHGQSQFAFRSRKKWQRVLPFAAAVLIFLGGCRSNQEQTDPTVEFTKVPPSDEGGPDKVDRIEGRVVGARPGQQIIIFAKSGRWWVQPLAIQPFTKIQPDSNWSSPTHLGTEYAAVLVGSDYQLPPDLDRLPQLGGGVIRVAIVKGENPHAQVSKVLQFSGYDWKVRSASSDRGGNINTYDTSNAWTDERGALHLRISKIAGQWRCAEVSLTRSLGYGLYRFVVRDTSHLEPAVVLGLFTWEEGGEEQNHREMDVEISRWGDPLSKNAQFVMQPYFVPANVARFDAPAGELTYSFRWKAGSVSFETTRGARTGSRAVAKHDFSSAIPTPGNELVHLNLYVYGNAASPPRNETEVVIEKFEFLP